ncbi:hypothetical protein BDAP_000684 [Binucleata daphniae]
MQIKSEQSKLLKKHRSMFELIKQYSMTYDLQKKVSCKVFFEDLPNHENFEMQVFEELHTIFKQNTMENVFAVYKTFENLMREILRYEFYDKDFFDKLCNAYCKAVLILIDNVETMLLSMDNIVIGYKILKYYCNKELNLLYLFEDVIAKNLSDKLKKNHVFCKILKFYKELVGELVVIDLENAKSFFYNDYTLQRKIILSHKISNLNSVFHDFETLIINLNVKIKDEFRKYGREQAYLKIMDYSSELVLENVVTNGEIIEDLKMFANQLINKKK